MIPNPQLRGKEELCCNCSQLLPKTQSEFCFACWQKVPVRLRQTFRTQWVTMIRSKKPNPDSLKSIKAKIMKVLRPEIALLTEYQGKVLDMGENPINPTEEEIAKAARLVRANARDPLPLLLIEWPKEILYLVDGIAEHLAKERATANPVPPAIPDQP